MTLADLAAQPTAIRDQAARLLHDSFNHPNGWPSLTAAREEVAAVIRQGFARALLERETLLGWIGGLPEYDGRVWELHPIVVDDDTGMTSLADTDLYADIPRHIVELRDLGRNHPFLFYRKLGFVVTGVMPDANGPGKPDIYMSKPVRGA